MALGVEAGTADARYFCDWCTHIYCSQGHSQMIEHVHRDFGYQRRMQLWLSLSFSLSYSEHQIGLVGELVPDLWSGDG